VAPTTVQVTTVAATTSPGATKGPIVTTVSTQQVAGDDWDGGNLVTKLKTAAAAGANIPVEDAHVVLKAITVSANYIFDDGLTLAQIRDGIAGALSLTSDTVSVKTTRRLLEARDVHGRRLAQSVKANIALTPKPNEDLAAKAHSVRKSAKDTTAIQKSLSNVAGKAVAAPQVGTVSSQMKVDVKLKTTEANAHASMASINQKMGKAVNGQSQTVKAPVVLTTAVAGTTTPVVTYTVTPLVRKDAKQAQVVGKPNLWLLGLIASAVTIAITFGVTWRRQRQAMSYTQLILTEAVHAEPEEGLE